MRVPCGVLLLLVLTPVLTGAGWLEDFSQQLCASNIRCYSRTYLCAHLLKVFNIQNGMLQVLSYCRSILGSSTLTATTLQADDVFAVMNGEHGEQLPECLYTQVGLVRDGKVNQAGLYLALSSTTISSDTARQGAFLDAVTNCPQPTKDQLLSFGACVIQACVQAL